MCIKIDYIGAVDAANNLRDNLTSYHDVIKTERWEMRFFGFFLGLCEANAFSSFRKFHKDGISMGHSSFKDQLAFEMLRYCQNLNSGRPSEVAISDRLLRSDYDHVYVSMSAHRNKRIRLACSRCKENNVVGTRVEKSCSCNPAAPLCDQCYNTHLREELRRQNYSGSF